MTRDRNKLAQAKNRSDPIDGTLNIDYLIVSPGCQVVHRFSNRDRDSYPL
jgi:hypothetical protein